MVLSYKHTKLACYGSYMTSAIASNYPPVLFIIFHKQFGLSLGALGILISINFGVQMFADIIGANTIDKIGYRKTAVVANFLVATGIILMTFLTFLMSSKFLALSIATVTYAIGSGLLEVLISPVMEAIPENTKASNMSFLHSFYSWGQLLAILVTTLFVQFFGSQNWWIIGFIWTSIPLFSAILFAKVPINTLPKEEKKSSSKVFKNKIYWLFLLLILASGASEIAVSQWASIFVETALGVSKTMGDLLGPCMFALLMGISRVLYAKYAKKLNLSSYMVLCSVLCTLAYIIMVFVPNKYIALAAVGLVGFSVGIMWPGALSLASVRFPLGGTALFAYMAIFGDIGCTFGPATAAFFSENTSFFASPLKSGILSCTIFPVTVIVLTLILKKMGRKNA